MEAAVVTENHEGYNVRKSLKGSKTDSSQPAVAGTSHEVPDQGPASSSSSNNILRVTLLAAEWGSFRDDVSTLNSELAKQLAKVNNVEVTVFVPKCFEEDKREAKNLGITIVKAEELLGYKPIDWLAFPPRDLSIDVVVGHGIELGCQAQIIKVSHQCRWVQVVHMNPEEEAMRRTGPGSLSKDEKKQQVELELCKRADFVIAVGPKLAEEFTASLRPCNTEVFELTPGIFSEFDSSKQASEDLTNFRVLVLGQTDLEDFELKGYDIAAHAFAELNDTSYHLIFVGAPKGKEEGVKQYLIQRGVSQEQLTVRSVCDSREKMADLFCVADLVIIPSRSEGFGLTALEALSAGLPLLVCGNSGFGKALSKVPFGSLYIVNSYVAKEWAEAVKRVRQKDRGNRLEEAKSLSTNYAKCYDWQNQCQLLVGKCHNMKLEDTKEKALPYQTTIGKKAFDIPYAMGAEESFEERVLKQDTKEKALPFLTTVGKKAFDIPYAMGAEESFEERVLKQSTKEKALPFLTTVGKKAFDIPYAMGAEESFEERVLKQGTKEKALPYQTTVGKKAFDIPYAKVMDPEESFEQPVLKTPKGSFSETVPGRTLILQDELKDEGASWELTVAAAHVTFPPQAVTEPQLITCSLWNPRMLSPPLGQQEALVSNVIELSLDGVSSPESSPCFMKEVTLCLSHSASKLEGYEIVIKQLIDKENNQWQDLETANTWHKASAGSSETVLPFAEVRVTHCSTFAAIWRLKSFMFSEKVTSVTLGNSFNVPDYPNISVTFPYGAISPTEEDISMEIKVQEVPHDGMRENGVLPGPILRLSCSHNTEFSKPLTITIPVSLREDVEDIPELMSSQLRIFYQNSDLASSEWEEITAQMDSPPEMNNGVVTFQVRHFSVFWVWFDWRSYSLSRVFLCVSNTYKRSMPQEAAFTACLCETSPCPPFQLALCCYPVHVREQVKSELLTSYAVVRHAEGNSLQPMCKGDNANIRLVEALTPVSGCEIESFFVRFLGDERFLRSGDLVDVAEGNAPLVQFSTPQYAGQQSKLLCRLLINPLPHAKLTLPPRQGWSRDQFALPGEVLEGLNSKTNEPKDIVVQLQENLQLDQAALKHPDPKTKQMIRSLAVKAKSVNRADVVEYLRTITPAGTTGPLLPEHQDVRDIPIKLRKDLTVNMCGGDEWKVLAESLRLTPAEIRYLDKRTLNPCDAALAHIANQFYISVGNLYDVLVNCEMPQYADIL